MARSARQLRAIFAALGKRSRGIAQRQVINRNAASVQDIPTYSVDPKWEGALRSATEEASFQEASKTSKAFFISKDGRILKSKNPNDEHFDIASKVLGELEKSGVKLSEEDEALIGNWIAFTQKTGAAKFWKGNSLGSVIHYGDFTEPQISVLTQLLRGNDTVEVVGRSGVSLMRMFLSSDLASKFRSHNRKGTKQKLQRLVEARA